MKPKRIFSLSLVVALIFSVFVPNANAENVELINENDALKAAKKYSQKIGIWEDAEFAIDSHLYDIDDSLLGYHMLVKINNEIAGYLVVSATKDRGPVMQYGTNIKSVRIINELKSKQEKIYYLGASDYVGAKSSTNLKEKIDTAKKTMLTELESQNLKNSEQYNVIKNKELRSLPKDPNSQDLWNSLLSTDVEPKQDVTVEAEYQKYLDVDPISQRLRGINYPNSSCGPTTAAMIVDYYKSRGYNVKAGVDYPQGDVDLINHLYGEMYSSYYGTVGNDFAAGLLQHLRHVNSNWLVARSPGEGYYGTYQSYIQGNAPVAIMFNERYSDWFNDDAKWHWLAGYGYNNTSGSYFYVRDPDAECSKQGSTASSWCWDSYKWVDYDQDMELVYSEYNW